ncbi:nuclear transport factor 2 family protein [Sandarakinorhabdus sp. DWP1-3-1]|uniref:nuclear transport factor 2 family protein n=1 Tax=Sandarakinorhabdus sp. DWP1-3-1 TaxID=2804627 RepID=UPI003CEEC6E8
MIRIALATALLLGASAAMASPETEVLAVVDQALVAVSSNDAALFQKVMLPAAIIVAQGYDADTDALATRTYTVARMAERLAATGPKIDERRTTTKVLVQRDLAHVWADYTLDVDGKRLHCGIDSFGLVKQDGAWRISSLTWTAEPKGCPK